MVDRDLNFNVGANGDKASKTFGEIAAEVDKLANRILRLAGISAKPTVFLNADDVQRKIDEVKRKLDEVQAKKASPVIDANIELAQQKLEQLFVELQALKDSTGGPKLDADIAAAEEKIRVVTAQLNELRDKRTDPIVDLQITAFEANIRKIEMELEGLRTKNADPVIDAKIANGELKIATMKQKIEDLNAQRADPVVDVQIAAAEAKLGTLIDELHRLQIERANVPVDADITKLEAKIAIATAELDKLNAKKIEIGVGADAEIALLSAKLAQLETTMGRVRAAGGAIRVAGAEGATKLATETAKADGELKKADASAKSLGVSLGALSGLAALAPGGARATGGALGAGIAAIIPAVASLGSSLQQMLGVAGLVPASLGFAAASVGTLKTAFDDFTKAVGPRESAAQIKAADQAMAQLSSQAQIVAKDLIALGPAWKSLKNVIQDNFWAGLGTQLQTFSKDYIPVLKVGLGGISTAFHQIAVDVLQWLNTNAQVQDAIRLFEVFKLTVVNLRPGILALVDAFKNIEVVGSTFLPGLTQGFTNLLVRFDAFTSRVRANGELQSWIANGMVALDQFGNLLKNVGGILSAVFNAAKMSGEGLLPVLSEATGRLSNFLKSGEGQTGLISLFTSINSLIKGLEPGVKALLSAVAAGIEGLKPAFAPVGQAISAIGIAIAPLIPVVANFAGPILAAAANAVTALVRAVGNLTPVLGPLLTVIGAAATAILNFGTYIVNAISGLGPLIPIVVNLALAWKGFALLVGPIQAVGVSIANMGGLIRLASSNVGVLGKSTTALGTGMQITGGVISKLGTALPFIGLAVAGLAFAFDAVKDHSASAAKAIADGSKTFSQGVQEEVSALQAQNFWLGTSATNQSVFNDTMGASLGRYTTVTAASQKLAAEQAAAATQAKYLSDQQGTTSSSLSKAGQEMSSTSQSARDLAAAQAAAANAGQNFTDKTTKVSDSVSKADLEMGRVAGTGTKLTDVYQKTATASDTVALAQAKVQQAFSAYLATLDPLQQKQAIVTELEGKYRDALQATGDKSFTTRDAAAALSRARDDLAKATDNETQATKSATQALIDNSNEVAAAANAAAGMKQADLNLEKQIATTRDTLKTHTAASIEGRQATLDLTNAYFADAKAAGDLAAANDVGKTAQDKARDSAIAYDQKLVDLANTTTGPVHQALLDAIKNIDGVSLSTDSATGKVKLLSSNMNAIPNVSRTISISATGTYQIPVLGGAATKIIPGGYTGGVVEGDGSITRSGIGPTHRSFATGGIMPGYTPGRDVFQINVSGGEAIMRPEWTRSVGESYIHRANSAASSGAGIPRPPGYSNGGVAGFANGGIAGDANQVGVTEFNLTQTAEANALADAVKKAIATIVAAAQALAASVAGGLGIPAGHASNVAAVQAAANAYGWGTGAQWNALVAVINRESGFNNVAQNPTSTAYGMFQFLDSTWASYGATKTSDPAAQAAAGLRYISQRYGTPAGALAHENAYGWYDDGGLAMSAGYLPKKTVQPERVLSPDQTRSFESLVQWLQSTSKTPAMSGASAAVATETTAEIRQLRTEMRTLGERISTSVANARPITVEDRSGNPTETARSVSLALRL